MKNDKMHVPNGESKEENSLQEDMVLRTWPLASFPLSLLIALI